MAEIVIAEEPDIEVGCCPVCSRPVQDSQVMYWTGHPDNPESRPLHRDCVYDETI